jgi:hypothetical protein
LSLDQLQIDRAFAILGLSLPSAAEVLAIESITDDSQAVEALAESPEVQAVAVPAVEMFYAAADYAPMVYLNFMVSPGLTAPQIADEIVSSQLFANDNNGGLLVDPNAPVTPDLVDAFFIRTLGHPPTVATLNGFEGLTNAQALLAFATSDAVSSAISNQVNTYIQGELNVVNVAGITQAQVETDYSLLGLAPPSASEIFSLQLVPDPVAAVYDIVNSAEVQTIVEPILLMFEVGLGHLPTMATLASMVSSGLTEQQLATAFVSSQAFADVHDEGYLVDPNLPGPYNFLSGYGVPSNEIAGLTAAQAFLTVVTSPSLFAWLQDPGVPYLVEQLEQADGIPILFEGSPVPDTGQELISALAALGLGAPPPAELAALQAANSYIGLTDGIPVQTILDMPEIQSDVVPVAQMFDVALGYFPVGQTLPSLVQSNLTALELATAIVSSQAFANVNNEGVLLNPNAPTSTGLVDALFIHALGHAPSAATLAGFEGMTNAQVLLELSTSATVSNQLAPAVIAFLTDVVELATGFPSETQIVGQAAHMPAGG